MAFYLDFTSILDTFKTEVIVYKKISGYDDYGRWQRTENETEVFYEPFVPNDRQGLYSVVSVLRDVGKVPQYNAVWISSQKVELNTKVEHAGKFYRVADIQDLTTYSNVTLYYLESEDKSDGNL